MAWQRSRPARSPGGIVGHNSTSMPEIRKRPASLRATRVTTVAVRASTSRWARIRQFISVAERQSPMAAPRTIAALGASAIPHRWALIEEQGWRARYVGEFRRDSILGDEPKVDLVRRASGAFRNSVHHGRLPRVDLVRRVLHCLVRLASRAPHA